MRPVAEITGSVAGNADLIRETHRLKRHRAQLASIVAVILHCVQDLSPLAVWMHRHHYPKTVILNAVQDLSPQGRIEQIPVLPVELSS